MTMNDRYSRVVGYRRQQHGLLIKTATAVLLIYCIFGGSCFSDAKNMNNAKYVIANTINKDFDTEYKDSIEYFDVYSPKISTYYSQVYWKRMDPVPLPKEIINRFSNNDKIMAIIGYEVNQVHVMENGTEIPIPITHAYNHHYIAYMFDSNKGQLVQKKVSDDNNNNMMKMGMTHGTKNYIDFQYYHNNEELLNNKQDNNDDIIPSAQVFSEGNGGEMRLSYHGYSNGYGQIIRSPNTWQIEPMQIDTWNREEPSPKFKTGPLPKISPVYNDSTAIYSGLLECPCTDRMVKKWIQRYKLSATDTDNNGTCPTTDKIQNVTECWKAGQLVVPARQVETHSFVNDKNHPFYCSIEQDADGILHITWNEPDNSTTEGSIDNQFIRRNENNQVVVAYASNAINTTVTLNNEDDLVTITMIGPADKWFGMGFGYSTMCRRMEADECQDSGPYAVIVYNDKVEERQLDFHGPGNVLPSTVNILTNTVSDGNRTVVLCRPLIGPDERYYTFDIQDASVPIIMARGCSMTFAQHCGHGASKLNFLQVDTPIQVCRDGVDKSIGGVGFGDNRCATYPTSTLLEQQNPTCSLETYSGGLSCCRHMQSLLDSDQEIPWQDQLLEYQLKFRYYFEEYTPASATTKASHKHLQRLYWMTEAFAGEYDITPCPPGTPSSQCIHSITSRWTVRQMIQDCKGIWCTGVNSTNADGIEIVYAGPHCHAPSCLSMELYNADTGELLCHVEPIKGKSTDKIYDEFGFLSIPPCLWGSEEGLMNPVFLPLNTTLLSIKRNNNTIRHFGEMASWQMRGVAIMNKEEGYENVDKEERASAFVNHITEQKMKSDSILDKELMVAPRTSVRRGRNED